MKAYLIELQLAVVIYNVSYSL